MKAKPYIWAATRRGREEGMGIRLRRRNKKATVYGMGADPSMESSKPILIILSYFNFLMYI
jgi:hypothetical protein